MLYFSFSTPSLLLRTETLSLKISDLLAGAPANLCFKSGQLMLEVTFFSVTFGATRRGVEA
jgi:hypothetical protein